MADGTRTIRTEALARVEGEGAMQVRIRGGEVENVELQIYEPPRFFEAFLRGRDFTEAPDITARICGICPIAYITSAFNAMEDALDVEVSEGIRTLRRLAYCGEWIESHALHVFLLHAPDFLGFESAWAMASDHREVVEGGLQDQGDRQRPAADDRRPRDPPDQHAGRRLLQGARAGGPRGARSRAGGGTRARPRFGGVGCRSSTSRTSSRTTSSAPCAIRTTTRSRMGGWSRAPASTSGPGEYEEHFTEMQVPHSTALQSRMSDGGTYFLGPMARYSLNSAQLSDVAREAAEAAGLGPECRNPFKSIVVRAVEILYAFDEALRLIEAYEPPDPPAVEITGRAATGCGWSEAPRGMLWHRYRLEDDGSIAEARIVPPTSQNQARIEQDLLEFVRPRVELPDDRLQWECEQAIRNYDPCISCSTHFLKLEVDRG